MPKQALAVIFLLSSVPSASAAQFHIIRVKPNGPCAITTAVPNDGNAALLDGNKVYATWNEAHKDMAHKDMAFVCRTG